MIWNKVVGLARGCVPDLGQLPDGVPLVPGYSGRFDETPGYSPRLGDLVIYRRVSVARSPHGDSYRIVSDIQDGKVRKAREWDGCEIPTRIFINAAGTGAETLGQLRAFD